MSTVIYSSMWYNLESGKDRRTVAYLIQHSQRRIRFSAYGMYDLSMETFSGVCVHILKLIKKSHESHFEVKIRTIERNYESFEIIVVVAHLAVHYKVEIL